MSATFNLPGTIITGGGASQELPAQVRRLGAQSVLLVTDRFLERQGLAARFLRMLEEAGVTASLFADVQPDPTDQNVSAGLEALRASGAEAVVALGGGSAIDAAKGIAVMATNDEPLHQYMGYHKIPRAGLPLVAIPTTAGTGSEVTKATVITDTARDVKMMILDAHLLPAVALVDYELSMSMPKPLTAHVGVDTLTHGIEAYVSRKANGMADPFARSCIDLCAQHLYAAWSDGGDRAAREGMALAACHGGAAFANSSVCLVHGMSRPLGALFHLPHGLSNAVLLPAVTRFSLAGAPARYAEVARALGFAERGASDEAAGVALTDGLAAQNERLEIPRLRDCHGMDAVRFEQALEKMAGDALASGSPQNNPIVPTAEQIMALYREAW
jgi:alcohol dehydrogenase class IV